MNDFAYQTLDARKLNFGKDVFGVKRDNYMTSNPRSLESPTSTNKGGPFNVIGQ